MKFVAGVSPEERVQTIERSGGTETGLVPALRLSFVSVSGASVDDAISRFEGEPSVQSVEEDGTRRAEAAPSDPSFTDQWGLQRIGWSDVFGTVSPTGSATIAVLDTGVDGGHPDVAPLLVAGHSAIAGASETEDANGHGTALATIAAAVTDNATGIAGVAYAGVRLMPVKVLDDAGLGQDSDVIAGLVWAADHDADVALMGFSNPGFSANLQEAVEYAWSRGMVLVAATGNEGSSSPSYPAGDAKVVGVAATDYNDTLWTGSNYGASAFLAAPGTNITAGTPGGGVATVTGTSASAAFVAGAAALLRANDPAASSGVIVGRLARNADPVASAEQTGNGRLNLARALADTSTDPVVPAGAPGGGPYQEPYTASFTFTVTSTNNVFDGVCSPAHCSLFEAIIFANSNATSADTINFSIPGVPPFIITPPGGGLPSISRSVTIDGKTQPGYAGVPLIVLNGTGVFNDGLRLQGVSGIGLSTVKGIRIQNFSGDGIEIVSSNNIVQGNYIGSDGASDLGNNGTGVLLLGGSATANTIGGSTANLRNVISGNNFAGVNVGFGANNNDIIGNYIGTNAGGTSAIGNGGGGGVLISGAGTDLGNIGSGEGNIISGNSGGGVTIQGSPNINNLVRGNYIGTDVNGTGDLGNSGAGVTIQGGATGNTIGGSAVGARNVIAGNNSYGVALFAPSNFVRGNYIGVDVTGTTDLSNFAGVIIGSSANTNTIGGTTVGDRNVISGNLTDGIFVTSGAFGATIQGNYIGTDATGTQDRGNSGDGVRIITGNHTIGGTATGAGNLISGNNNDGVELNSSGSVVQGNLIGTNATGDGGLGNSANGVWSLASGNTIGGTVTGAGNVISANGFEGVRFSNSNTLQGNYIGTDVSGSADLGNNFRGVFVSGGSGSIIGGTATDAGNVVSGNGLQGILLGSATSAGVVQGNFIGTDAVGIANLGNGESGVHVSGTSYLIGGTAAGAANVIAFNLRGVTVDFLSGNRILSNSIHSNTNLGIDLAGGFGVTPNDAGDGDGGPNTLQNFPELTVVNAAGVSGTLNSTASSSFTIQLFTNAACDSSGNGEGRTLLATLTGVPTDGSGNGSFFFPAALAPGTIVTATATNASNNTSEFSACKVMSVNSDPTATDDSHSVAEDGYLNILVPGVLGNDSDPDLDTLTASLDSDVSNGVLVFNADGSFTYDPDDDYFGPDGFSYSISDGNGGTDSASVNITVWEVNDAPVPVNDSASVAEDSLAGVLVDVLANDAAGPPNESSQTKSIGTISTPSHGTAVLESGQIRYTPTEADYNGPDSFTYQSCDDGTTNGVADPLCTTATVGITVLAVNDPPNAVNDSATVAEDSLANIVYVLSNDTYAPDVNETLSITSVSDPPNGSTSISNSGTPLDTSDDTVLYSPDANYFGADSFTYTISDGNGGFDTATVNITVTEVNDAPVPVNDSASVAEDNAGGVLVDVLANDSVGPASESSQTKSIGTISTPSHGTAVLESGQIRYTPTEADYNGPDSFTYQSCDDGTTNGVADPLCTSATVNITVWEVNDAPVPVNDSASVAEDNAGGVLVDVLANDSVGPASESSQTKSIGTISTPSHGTAVLESGQIRYTPTEADYNGPNSFTYQSCDDGTTNGVADPLCTTATVNITVWEVNDAPVPVDDSASVAEDNAGGVLVDVLANDAAGPPNESSQTKSIGTISTPSHGTAVLESGQIRYTPTEADYNGPDSFTYQSCDDGTTNGAADPLCTTATVNITVWEVNDAPVPVDDSASVAEDNAGGVLVDVLANDAAGPANESAQTKSIGVIGSPSHGTAVLEWGQIRYTPTEADYNGPDSFTYQSCDDGTTNGAADPLCTVATVNNTVWEVNDAPVPVDDSASVNEDDAGGVLVNVLANDATGPSNESGQTKSIGTISTPSHGTAVLESGQVRYTPTELNYNGPDSFTYQSCDDGTTNGAADPLCTTATVGITVIPVNDAPVLTLSVGSVTAQYSDPISTVTATVTDVDNPLSDLDVSATGLPMGSDLVLGPKQTNAASISRTISGRLNVAAGSYPVSVVATDTDLTDTETLTVNVQKEDATVDNFTPDYVQVDGSDGDKDALTVGMIVDEVQDGYLSGTLSSGAGLANAEPIAVSLTPVGPGSTFGCSATNTTYIAADPDSATASCTMTNVLVNVYEITATIGGNYFTGSGIAALTVFDPAAGFTTGGGWFLDSLGYKVNYGFNVKYLKKKIQGSLLMIWHRPDGVRVLKSNALGSLAVTHPADFWAATFNGKATFATPYFQTFCGAYKCGNYSFTAYVEDKGEPGAGNDRIWIQLKDPTGAPVASISMPTTASANAVTIGGGNIQVPH